MTAPDQELGPDHDVTTYDVVAALASRVNWAGDESGKETVDRWLAANAPSDDDQDDDDQADDVDEPAPVTPAAAAARAAAGKPGSKTTPGKGRPTPKRS